MPEEAPTDPIHRQDVPQDAPELEEALEEAFWSYDTGRKTSDERFAFKGACRWYATQVVKHREENRNAQA